MDSLQSKWKDNLERVAFSFNNLELTYGELIKEIEEKTKFLESIGIREKKHVALKISNPICYCIHFLALWTMKATIIPIDTQISGTGLDELLLESDAEFYLSDILDISFEEMQKENRERGCLQTIILYRNDDMEKIDLNVQREAEYWEDKEGLQAEWGFLLLFTSGTSGNGKAKGVFIKKENFLNNAKKVVEYTELTNKDSILLTLPLTYCFALSQLLAHLMVCGTCYLSQGARVSYRVLNEIANYRVTNYATTPYFFETIEKAYIEKANYNFDHLRFIMSAGSYLSQGVIQHIKDCFGNVVLFNNYGQTEASPRISYHKIDTLTDDIASVGKPLKGVEIGIFDEDRKQIQDGSIGIIGYRSEDAMEGYYKRCVVDKKEFILSGDLGYLNEEGKLFIKGRKDSMMKVNGRKVYKNIMEDELYTLFCIKSIRIKKERHVYYGEYFTAYIVLNDACQKDKALKVIREYCREHFDKFSRPKKYIICEKFELNSNQKVIIKEVK